MKKFKKFAAIIAAALIVLSLSSCEFIKDAEITSALPGVEAGDIRIGILYSEDYEHEDTAAHVQHEALNTMMRTYEIAGTIQKNKIPVDNEQKIRDSIISCVKESGCNVVLSTDPTFTKIVYEFANNEEYNNIIFVCLDGTKKYEATENFHCFYPDYAQAYCLAGIVAASKSDSNNIALTDDNSELVNAFELGAKAVNAKSKVISGSKIDTYGTIETNWHVYYITLVEKITLGEFSDMGDYYTGVETGFCEFVPSEDYSTDEGLTNLTEARNYFCDGHWDLTKSATVHF